MRRGGGPPLGQRWDVATAEVVDPAVGPPVAVGLGGDARVVEPRLEERARVLRPGREVIVAVPHPCREPQGSRTHPVYRRWFDAAGGGTVFAPGVWVVALPVH